MAAERTLIATLDADPTIRWVSFDVFDTLVTRPSITPDTFFGLIGRALQRRKLIRCSAHAFAEQRRRAEQRAFRNHGGYDSAVDLAAIYRELASGLQVDPDQAIACELQTELELAIALPPGIRALRQTRETGRRIAFLSDMYLGRRTIEVLLERFDIMQPEDLLLVSSDYAESKRSGALFTRLCTMAQIEPAQLLHVGNDTRGDILMPGRMGAKVFPLTVGNPTRYELELARHDAATDGCASLLAGAGRLARASAQMEGGRERIIAQVSAGVAAPMVIAFVLWVLMRSHAQGVKRLYFVARDGQLLMRLAHILAGKLGLPVEVRYIHGSRLAWQRPMLAQDYSQGLALMREAVGIHPTPAMLADWLGMSPSAVIDVVVAAGGRSGSESDPLDDTTLDRVIEHLRTNETLRAQVQAAATVQRDLAIRYLQEQGFADTGPMAIVDLGTGETLVRAASHLRSSLPLHGPDHRDLTGYYYGRRAGKPSLSLPRPPVVHSYLFDVDARTGFYDDHGVISFLEACCSADHGSTCGYREEDGRVVPEFADAGNDPVIDWGYPLVASTIAAVAQALPDDGDLHRWQVDLREACLAAFRLFWQSPDRREGQVWGTFPLDDGNGRGSVWLTLGSRFHWTNLIRRQPRHRHWWREGAIAAASQPLRALAKARQQCLTVLRKVMRQIG